MALLDVEGGHRSALLWTLLRGSTTEPHPDILPPIRLILVVMKVFRYFLTQSLGMGVVSLAKGLEGEAW